MVDYGLSSLGIKDLQGALSHCAYFFMDIWLTKPPLPLYDLIALEPKRDIPNRSED